MWVYRWWFRDPLTKILFKGTSGKIGGRNLTRLNLANVSDGSRTPSGASPP
jgi:NAD(P)H dehydrogenase (quinone)